jgi:hypothetical protein
MAVKDVTDLQPEPLFKGPRAGNTTTTMAPKTVNVLDPEPTWNSAGDPNYVPRPKEVVYSPDEPQFEPKIKGKPALPVRQSFQDRTAAKVPLGLENRVTKLEERVDALMDRIAVHNIRAQHKL